MSWQIILWRALGGAIAILAMHFLAAMYFVRAFHPPAGIDPLIIVNESLPWSFLFTTVLPGSLLLLGFALLWHNAPRRGAWPARWR